jgi:hypothetical protein
LLYFEPYQGTFFIGNPNLTKAYLHLNADTGDAVEDIPANIRIVDAEWLRKFKQNVWKEALIKFPELPFSKSHHPDTDELIKKRQAQTALIRKNRYGLLFSRVEKAI